MWLRAESQLSRGFLNSQVKWPQLVIFNGFYLIFVPFGDFLLDFLKKNYPLQIIRLRREEESLDNIGQYWVQCETEELKYTAIANIYGVVTIGQAMIFCQTRKTASWLVDKMTKDGHAVALLSGKFLNIFKPIFILLHKVVWEGISFLIRGHP